ncbi:hypothetical protein CTI12_AA119470 [Artemisia annua]|uniref:Uncharacterized protein n=1 Tax=Artemisia annua TaxID=35608 RepID=A0A2U1PS32_ARTAN|nr:hypothetical protein CTI12_AA119470 [Artemisia annua]
MTCFCLSSGRKKVLLESGIWLVNNKPLVVQRWNPNICIDRSEPEVLPIWIKLFNVSIEAWTVKGISAIASSLGNRAKNRHNNVTRGVNNVQREPNKFEMNKGPKIPKNRMEFRPVEKKTNLGNYRDDDATGNGVRGSIQDQDKQNGNKTANGSRSPWKITPETVASIRKSANKYAIFENIEDCAS